MKSFTMLVCYVLCIPILFVSCKKNKEVYQQQSFFDRNDFVTKELIGEPIDFDEPLMKPKQLIVYDTLLITCNQNTEKHFHLFNLKNKKKIGERITMGQGPEEMLRPTFINSQDSIRLYDMMNSTVYSYSIYDFVHSPEPIPISRYKLNESFLFSELGELSDGQLIGVSNKPDAPCYLFNKAGDKIKNIGDYPINSETYTDVERADAYRAILTSNGKDKIAICHFFTDLIDIYDKNGQLEKRLFGPDHFYTRFTEFHDGNRIGSKPDPNAYRDAFYSPVSVKDDFYVLYNGKIVNKPDYNLLAEDIFVFGWDGKPKIHYKLDKGVLRIAVDTQKHKIYGISNQPEYHIIEFSFD